MTEHATRGPGGGEPSPAEAHRRGLRSLLAVLALAVGFAVVPRAMRGCEGAGVGGDAPDFRARVIANAEALEGAPAALELSSLHGRTVVLDFWATWCGPCQIEAPIVNAIAERYKSRGLAVVGVNTSDDEDAAIGFVRKKKLGFPIVYDQGNRIAREYGVSSLPTLVVISKTGKVVAVRRGVTSDSALDELVRRHL